MWGSNVPVTRTPDAQLDGRGPLPRNESGQRQPRLRRQYENSPTSGIAVCGREPDGALAMAMGHVILSECFVHNRVPFFVDYVRQYTDLPFLVKLEERDGPAGARQEPHRRRSRPGRRERRVQTGACSTERPTPSRCRRARWDSVTEDDGLWASGTWISATWYPALTVAGARRAEPRLFILPRFDTVDGQRRKPCRGGCRYGRSASTWCAPLFDLNARPVRGGPAGAARDLAHRVRRRRRAVHPGLA